MANEQSLSRKHSVSYGGINIGGTVSIVAANGVVTFQQTIPAGVDTQIAIPMTAANLSLVAVESSTDATLYTNAIHSGSPTQTIALKAGVAQIWDKNLPAAQKIITADVTTMYLTNVADTILKFIIGMDDTPAVSG